MHTLCVFIYIQEKMKTHVAHKHLSMNSSITFKSQVIKITQISIMIIFQVSTFIAAVLLSRTKYLYMLQPG